MGAAAADAGRTSKSMPLAAIALLLASLGTWEGMKQVPYRDNLAPGRPWTVCKGITGPDVIPGKRYSVLECEEIETRYVQRMAKRMEPCVRVPLSVYEWVAWGDFSYNLGIAKFCGSTAAKLLQQGRRREACHQIPRWKFTDGKDCSIAANECGGIIKRRRWQHETCLKGI